MLFQNKLKELYNDIQLSFGFKRLDECFTVDVDFKNENFVLKAIKCLSNFVNEENSARPWNRFSHFTKFIAPVFSYTHRAECCEKKYRYKIKFQKITKY